MKNTYRWEAKASDRIYRIKEKRLEESRQGSLESPPAP